MATSLIIDMRATDMSEHLEWVFRGTRGYVSFGLWNLDTKKMREYFFHWPKQKKELYSWLEKHREDEWTEIFFCPLPRSTSGKRYKDDAVSYGVLWADVDEALDKGVEGTLRRWGARLVATGRPGAVHVYLRLRESLNVVQWQGYQRALRQYVAGDAKIADNDFLKLPGSWNYKNHPSIPQSKRLSEPVLSQVSTQGRTVSNISDLLQPVEASQVESVSTSNWSGVAMPTRIPDWLRALMHEGVGTDRSEQCAAMVWAVADYVDKNSSRKQYTIEQCHVMLDNYAPGVDKYGSRWHEEIDRLWAKRRSVGNDSGNGRVLVIDPEIESDDKELIRMSDAAEHKFFVESGRKLLRHIYQSCLCTQANPWAVWGVVKLRMLHTIPARVWIPGHGAHSLNCFIALVGRSGAGKKTATDTAKGCVDVGQDIYPIPLGSGQAIPKLYRKYNEKDQKLEVLTNSVLFEVPEVAAWNALTANKESMLDPELCKAFSGETLGFSWADPVKAVVVKEDSYRLGLYVSVQAAMAQPLFKKQGMGLPQRFLWFPTFWSDAPDGTKPLPEKYRWQEIAPEWPTAGRRVDDKGRYVMAICQDAREEIAAIRTIQARGQDTADPLDSHRVLVRLKAACALAIADGRTRVNEQDWELSGYEMAVSNATRETVVKEMERQELIENARRGKGDAVRKRAARHAEEEMDQKQQMAIQEVAEKIRGLMKGKSGIGMGKVKIATRKHRYIQAAVQMLGYKVIDAKQGGQRIVKE